MYTESIYMTVHLPVAYDLQLPVTIKNRYYRNKGEVEVTCYYSNILSLLLQRLVLCLLLLRLS